MATDILNSVGIAIGIGIGIAIGSRIALRTVTNPEPIAVLDSDTDRDHT